MVEGQERSQSTERGHDREPKRRGFETFPRRHPGRQLEQPGRPEIGGAFRHQRSGQSQRGEGRQDRGDARPPGGGRRRGGAPGVEPDPGQEGPERRRPGPSPSPGSGGSAAEERGRRRSRRRGHGSPRAMSRLARPRARRTPFMGWREAKMALTHQGQGPGSEVQGRRERVRAIRRARPHGRVQGEARPQAGEDGVHEAERMHRPIGSDLGGQVRRAARLT